MNGIKPDFELALNESEAYFDQAEKARKAMEGALQSALDKLRGVEKRISAGESSGDPITDFVFRHQFASTVAMVRRYHKLNDAIAAHRGEFALVVEREKVDGRLNPHLEAAPGGYRLRVWCSVGVICGEGLILDAVQGRSAIPTGKHLQFSRHPAFLIGGDVLDPNSGLIPDFGDICLRSVGRDLGASLDVPLEIKNPVTRSLMGDAGCAAVEVHIGDQEVARWFGQNSGTDSELLAKVAEYFGRRMPEVPAA